MIPQHTDSVHQRGLKRPVFHANFGGAKKERLLDKVSATLMRTAEVTICIIPEGLLDRPRQSPTYKFTPDVVMSHVGEDAKRA